MLINIKTKFQKTEYWHNWCLCFNSVTSTTTPPSKFRKTYLRVKKQPEIIKFCPKILTKQPQKYNPNILTD